MLKKLLNTYPRRRRQGSVRLNLMEEVSPPTHFLSCCTYSMFDSKSLTIKQIGSVGKGGGIQNFFANIIK